jgi:hypothetical protein
LLQAVFLGKVQPQLETLEQLQHQIARLHAQALGRLQALDAAWQILDNRAVVLPRLEELAQTFGFHRRWRAQLQEAHLRLTL